MLENKYQVPDDRSIQWTAKSKTHSAKIFIAKISRSLFNAGQCIYKQTLMLRYLTFDYIEQVLPLRKLWFPLHCDECGIGSMDRSWGNLNVWVKSTLQYWVSHAPLYGRAAQQAVEDKETHLCSTKPHPHFDVFCAFYMNLPIKGKILQISEVN